MDNAQRFWRQYGGHVVLVLTALFFVLKAQLNGNRGLVASTTDGETAVSFRFAPTATPPPAEAAPQTADVTAETNLAPLPVLYESGLAPAPNPRTYQPKLPEHQFKTYIVQPNDTPNRIADSQGISAATLLGGNPWLSQESNLLQTGVELIILPVDGALHTVRPGETLERIAAQYNVTVAEIIAYEPNNIEFSQRLYPDTQLLIPGVEIGSFYWTAPKSVGGSGGETQWAVVGTGSFNWPVSGRCVTTFYWYGHPGLDISLSVGSPVLAADTGTVTYASWASGTYYDYGNLIVINHGNGFETFYAHLSSIHVYPGQIIEKGQTIGASGNSGRSSGPHIHIEIRLNDARLDPLSYLSGAVQNCTGS